MADLRRESRSDPLANAAIIFTTVLWGTLWIPLRQMNAAGASDASAATVSLALCLLFLVPLRLYQKRLIGQGGWPLIAAGFFMALSIALYSEGLVRGQVARVILLFYLTPVWSTLLGRLLLGEPVTAGRVLAILLGLAGALVIFGAASGLPLPRSAGDWMGLLSGIAWALAMVYVNRTGDQPVSDRIFVQFLFLAPLYFLITSLPGTRAVPGVEIGAALQLSIWVVAFAVLWMLPVVALSVFGGSRLDPGRVAVFLMLEIVIGLASASLLTDEPFGWRELLGAALIMSASLAEFVGRRPARSPA